MFKQEHTGLNHFSLGLKAKEILYDKLGYSVGFDLRLNNLCPYVHVLEEITLTCLVLYHALVQAFHFFFLD